MIQILSKTKARLRVNTGSGKKRKVYTKTVTYSGKKDLNRQYAEFEAEIKRSPLTGATLEDIIVSYIEDRKGLGITPTTARGYQVCLNRIPADLKDEKASKVLPIQIQDYIAKSQNRLAPKTIRNDIALISSAYTRAIRLGLLDTNPCALVELPKQSQKEMQTLSEEQIASLLEVLEKERLDYKVGYLLCLFCGLRRSEVLGLREQDIDFERSCIHIHRTRHRVRKQDSVQNTKTVKSKRTLAVPKFLFDDIRLLVNLHRSYSFNTSDYLILTEFGEPMNPSTFSIRLQRLTGGTSVHGLRHTFATLLNAQGIDIARISAELGHSNIHTTLSIYTHVFGGASASSQGIADAINEKYSKK